MDENIMLIDWFSFSVKDMDHVALISWLGLSDVDWQPKGGRRGYSSSKTFGKIWIMYDGQIVYTDKGPRDMGVCVEMSGQGCRQYETSGNRSLETLVNDVSKMENANITRLDIAYDDIDKNGSGLLNVGKIERLARIDRYISKFGSKSGAWSGKHSDGSEKAPLAYSVYFGSPQSHVRFRIYDKAMERGGLDYHWVRFEIQFRDKQAYNFIIAPGKIGYKFTGVINNYLRFITPNKNDTNRRRWASPEWWTKFLSHTEKVSVFTKKDVEYNLAKVERYIRDQAGNTIFTYIKCVGWMRFRELMNETDRNLNPNQQKLIAEYKEIMDEKTREFWENMPGTRI